MNSTISKRIEKAEKLDAETREKFLFKYLELKNQDAENQGIEEETEVLWTIFVGLINYAEQNKLISVENLVLFLEEFEKEWENKKDIKKLLDILQQFSFYLFKRTSNVKNNLNLLILN